MEVLRSRLDPNGADFRENLEAFRAPRGRARRAAERRGLGRRKGRRRPSPGAQEAPPARPHRPDRRPGIAVPRAFAARGLRPLRGRGAVGRDRDRDRTHPRPALHGDRERRHGEGRHLLPAHRQEARPRAGDRAEEPAALRLPRRFGRRVPAPPGRGLPRQGALRPDLLQPGTDVGGRDSRRSPRCWARARRAARTSRRCRTSRSS